jgi:hypothetical protein
MAPTPPLLNATCVALETVDYLSKCSFIPPPEILGVVILCAGSADVAKEELIDSLWRTPTEKLHKEVEKKFLQKKADKDQIRLSSKFNQRTRSSMCKTNSRNNTKITTLVEDLSKLPSTKPNDYSLPAERLNGGVAALLPAPAGDTAPVTVTTTVTTTTTTEVRRETPPVTGSGSGGMVASGPSGAGTGPASLGENDKDDAPPAYPH